MTQNQKSRRTLERKNKKAAKAADSREDDAAPSGDQTFTSGLLVGALGAAFVALFVLLMFTASWVSENVTHFSDELWVAATAVSLLTSFGLGSVATTRLRDELLIAGWPKPSGAGMLIGCIGSSFLLYLLGGAVQIAARGILHLK